MKFKFKSKQIIQAGVITLGLVFSVGLVAQSDILHPKQLVSETFRVVDITDGTVTGKMFLGDGFVIEQSQVEGGDKLEIGDTFTITYDYSKYEKGITDEWEKAVAE